MGSVWAETPKVGEQEWKNKMLQKKLKCREKEMAWKGKEAGVGLMEGKRNKRKEQGQATEKPTITLLHTLFLWLSIIGSPSKQEPESSARHRGFKNSQNQHRESQWSCFRSQFIQWPTPGFHCSQSVFLSHTRSDTYSVGEVSRKQRVQTLHPVRAECDSGSLWRQEEERKRRWRRKSLSTTLEERKKEEEEEEGETQIGKGGRK